MEATGVVAPSWEPGSEGPGLKSIACTIRLRTSEGSERLKTVQEQLEKRCPVGNTLRRAGVKMEIDWQVTFEET